MDAAFVDAVSSLDPRLHSREKSALLREELQLTRDEVYALASDNNISLRTSTNKVPPRQAIVDLDDACVRLKAGETMADIAVPLGICSKTLQRFLRLDAGIASRHDIHWTDDEVTDAVVELREDPCFADTGISFTQGELLA